jgi:ribosomal protein S18 acetylase RimI-like enzyme
LVETVVSEAKARGGSFVWWLARESNADARAFYSTLGLFTRADVVAHAKVIED